MSGSATLGAPVNSPVVASTVEETALESSPGFMPQAPQSDDPLASATIGSKASVSLEPKTGDAITSTVKSPTAVENAGTELGNAPAAPSISLRTNIWNSFAGPGNDSSAVSVVREIPRAFGSDFMSGVGYTAFNSPGLVTAFGGAVIDGIGRTLVEHGASLFRNPDVKSVGWWAQATAGALEVTGGAALAVLGTTARLIGNGIASMTKNQ